MEVDSFRKGMLVALRLPKSGDSLGCGVDAIGIVTDVSSSVTARTVYPPEMADNDVVLIDGNYVWLSEPTSATFEPDHYRIILDMADKFSLALHISKSSMGLVELIAGVI